MSLAVALMIATVGLSSFLWYSQNDKIKGINTNISNSQAKLNSLNTIINKINDKEKKKNRLEDILKAIGGLEKIRSGPTRVFDEINTLIPSDLWLTSIMESGGNIKIDGYSFSDPGIANFMKSLDTSKYFSNVELLEIQQIVIEGEKVKKFTLNTVIELSQAKKLEGKPQEAGGKVGGT
ncbi:MAG: hypothetical protein A2328_09510 [Bdellovibrionales bacterium RIFOXYB2_FULL_36_6]|nr:MAG: hypothetical protein A2328_09510 [Bdellovibrionales bacterium RIFOXYB2_FULL_36_6]